MGNSSADFLSAYFNETYPSYYSSAFYASERSLGDQMFGCPAHWTSKTLASLPIYHYFFTHASPDAFTPYKQPLSLHSMDLNFMWNSQQYMKTEEDKYLAKAMATYWAEFVISGDPNTGLSQTSRLPTWPQYGDSGHIVLLDKESAGGIRSLPLAEAPPGPGACAWLDTWMQRSLRAWGLR